MAAREPGDPARADLAAVGDEPPQRVQVLVVDVLDVDPGVLARPEAIAEAAATARARPAPGSAGLAACGPSAAPPRDRRNSSSFRANAPHYGRRRMRILATGGSRHWAGAVVKSRACRAGSRERRVLRTRATDDAAPRGLRRPRLERDVVVGCADGRRLAAGPSKSEVSAGTSDCGASKPLPPPLSAPPSRLPRNWTELAMIETAWRLPEPSLRLPLAPVEPALDRDRAALGQVGRAVLALGAEDRDVEVVGLVDPVAAAVLAAGVDRDAQLADARPAAGAAELGIAGQVAR